MLTNANARAAGSGSVDLNLKVTQYRPARLNANGVFECQPRVASTLGLGWGFNSNAESVRQRLSALSQCLSTKPGLLQPWAQRPLNVEC